MPYEDDERHLKTEPLRSAWVCDEDPLRPGRVNTVHFCSQSGATGLPSESEGSTSVRQADDRLGLLDPKKWIRPFVDAGVSGRFQTGRRAYLSPASLGFSEGEPCAFGRRF